MPMPLSELTDQNAVLSAIREYDALGSEAFLAKYGYAPARKYRLVHNGRKYDSKAIAGAAFGFQFPDRGALRSDEFSGGEATVRPILESFGFKVDSIGDDGQQTLTPKITYEDIDLIRRSRGKDRYNDLSAEERAAYQRVHDALTLLGGVALRVLEGVGQFSVTLTSQFYPQSGVRGAIPKDLWFAVSNDLNRETFVGMPQLFMIVSEHGIEYGFAASIHPSDFSSPPFQQRVRNAAPRIFAALPSPGSPAGIALKASVDQSGKWFFRRKTRLDPNVKEYSSLDEWLSFLKSPAGTKSAGGSISRYLTDDDLKRSELDLESLVREAAEIFSPLMQTVTPVALEGKPEISVRDAIDEFLSKFLSFRTTISFGQHEELKILLNQLRAGLEEFSSLRAHPHVRVSWSLGAGNWARIPWIAFMDERETTSTLRGVYCVMLFPEDMVGCLPHAGPRRDRHNRGTRSPRRAAHAPYSGDCYKGNDWHRTQLSLRARRQHRSSYRRSPWSGL
jgi:MrcB-like, N-terminal domain